MATRLRGRDAWRYSERCTLCGGTVRSDEDVYVVGIDVLHEECLRRLLEYPEGRFREVLAQFSSSARRELEEMRRGRVAAAPAPARSGVATVTQGRSTGETGPAVAGATPGPATTADAGERRALWKPWPPSGRPPEKPEEEVREFKHKLDTIFHAVEEHDWERLKTPDYQKILGELREEAKKLSERGLIIYDWSIDPLFTLKWAIDEEDAERALWAICRVLLWLDPAPREGAVAEKEPPGASGATQQKPAQASAEAGGAGELPDPRVLTREEKRVLWSKARAIVDSALKETGLRYVGEMRIDGLAPEPYSRFLLAIRDKVSELLKEPRRVEFKVQTYLKGFADTDVYVDGEYLYTWRPVEPYVGAFRNWVHRVYNLLRTLAERGLLKEEVLARLREGDPDRGGALDRVLREVLREYPEVTPCRSS